MPSPPDFAVSPLRYNREGREGGSRLAVPSDFAAHFSIANREGREGESCHTIAAGNVCGCAGRDRVLEDAWWLTWLGSGL